MRRTKRRKSQQMHFQEFWDSCAQNKTSELNKNTVKNSRARVRRTKRRKYQQIDFQELWDSCAQDKTSKISKHALSGILGLLCAEQDVGNLKKCTVKNSGTPARRTQRRISQNMTFQEIWDSGWQNKTSEISKKCTFRNYGTPGSWIQDP